MRSSFGGIQFEDVNSLDWNTFEFSTTTTTPPPPPPLPLIEVIDDLMNRIDVSETLLRNELLTKTQTLNIEDVRNTSYFILNKFQVWTT